MYRRRASEATPEGDGEEGDDEGLDVDVRLVELVEAVAERVVEVPAQVGVEVQPRHLNLPRAADERARRRVRALLPRDRRRRLPRLRHVVHDGRQVLVALPTERAAVGEAARARVCVRVRVRAGGRRASRSGGPAVTLISRLGHSLSYSSGGLSPPGTTAGFEPHTFLRQVVKVDQPVVGAPRREAEDDGLVNCVAIDEVAHRLRDEAGSSSSQNSSMPPPPRPAPPTAVHRRGPHRSSCPAGSPTGTSSSAGRRRR